MMMPCVYPPMTPKLPLPPMGVEPAVEAPPSPQLEVKKPTTKRRKQTVAASVTASRWGALRRGGDVAGVVAGGGGCQLALEQSAFARPLRAADGRSVGAIRR